MAITQYFKNMEHYYNECPNAIVLNGINVDMQDSISSINKKFYTVYSGDLINTAPRCDCGRIRSRIRVGKFCKKCNSYCKDNSNDTKPILWMQSLGVKFINPGFWLMLKTYMDKNVDCLRYLSDTSYNPVKRPEYLPNLVNLIGGRKYTNLIDNMEKVIEYVKNLPKQKKDKKFHKEMDALKDIWIEHKDVILCDILPIPNKSIFIMENTSKGRFINLIVGDVVNIANEWIRITSDSQIDERHINKYTAKTISGLANLSMSMVKDYVVGKPGIFRKHLYGARSPFTFRNTITCVPKPHDYDIVELPWSIGCSAYQPYVLNKLVARGYKYKDAQKLIYKSVEKYDETIAEILDELVAESPYKGLPLNMQRNPTLLQGSAQLVFGVFKKDPKDKTVSVSKLIISHPNGDYDGDALNFTILNDILMTEEFEVYSPHYNIPGLNRPYEISGNLTMQGPANQIMMEYLRDKREVEGSDDDFWNKYLKVR